MAKKVKKEKKQTGVKTPTPLDRKGDEPKLKPIPNDDLYAKSAMDRFNKLPSYGQFITAEKIQSLFAHYLFIPLGDLESVAAAKKNELSVIDHQILTLVQKAADTKSKDGIESMKYLHERAFGKPKQSIELTGAGGGPLAISSEVVLEAMDNLPPEVLQVIVQGRKQKG